MKTNGICGVSPANNALDLLSEIMSVAVMEINSGYILEAEQDYGIKITEAFRILKKTIDKAESM